MYHTKVERHYHPRFGPVVYWLNGGGVLDKPLNWRPLSRMKSKPRTMRYKYYFFVYNLHTEIARAQLPENYY